MKTMLKEKGSQWHKWDLHIHTPESIVHRYGDSTSEEIWEKYISDLENLPEEYKVIGINDYFFLDGYERLLKEQQENNRLQNLVLFPVVEFRIEKFAGVEFKKTKRINLHVIFSPELTISTIKSQFLNTLEQYYVLEKSGAKWQRAITRESIEELGKEIKSSVSQEELSKYGSDLVEGFNNLNVDEKVILNSLDKDCFKDKYLIAIGKTEWDELKWSDSSIATKKTIINQADIVFTASENLETFYDAKSKLKENKVNDFLFDCSDAHSFSSDRNEKDRIGNCNNWIKSDITFKGLKQVLIEKDRLFVGEKPEIIDRVLSNRTKYIKTVNIDKIDSYNGEYGTWFENISIPLNSELVAIIGNKGSGKSALADMIALCANYKNHSDFSFLKKGKFRDGKHAKNFNAKLIWESNTENFKKLDDESSDGVELVKYLPQGYFERLTNEIDSIADFQREIENVVFTHIKDDDKVGYSSFSKLIDDKKKTVNYKINSLKERLQSVNEDIIAKERKLNIDYSQELKNKIEQKKQELSALIEPVEVKNPNTDPNITKENQENSEKITQLKEEISKLEENINTKQAEKQRLILESNKIKELKELIQSKEKDLEYFKQEQSSILAEFELIFDNIVQYKFDYLSIDLILQEKQDEINKIKIEIGEIPSVDVEQNISLSKKIEIKKTELKAIQEKLGKEEKEYQKYLELKKVWETNKNNIIGDDKTPNTLKCLEKELKYVTENLQQDIDDLKENRIDLSKQIFEAMNSVLNVYTEVKSSIDKIISDNEKLLGEYKISIDASFVLNTNFVSKFLSYISLNRVGTYYGKDNADKQIRKIIEDVDFNKFDSVKEMLEKIIESLFKNLNKDNEPTHISNQVNEISDLYEYLFSLNFIEYNYQLKQGGKTLQQLSPGEKGALLLIFYLLLDNNDIPLIIDQPEDNLDNDSVANILVPFIKRAKSKRQIILVTHNPNLAVVADAEQIIYVELDKKNSNKFSFKSGAIENPEINRCIVKVLEGAMPAFNNRKYKCFDK